MLAIPVILELAFLMEAKTGACSTMEITKLLNEPMIAYFLSNIIIKWATTHRKLQSLQESILTYYDMEETFCSTSRLELSISNWYWRRRMSKDLQHLSSNAENLAILIYLQRATFSRNPTLPLQHLAVQMIVNLKYLLSMATLVKHQKMSQKNIARRSNRFHKKIFAEYSEPQLRFSSIFKKIVLVMEILSQAIYYQTILATSNSSTHIS